jgi:hypothetical protein
MIRDSNKKIFVFPDGELVDKLLVEYSTQMWADLFNAMRMWRH